RHAKSAGMRNQHKGLERRWFEQCTFFCRCHSPRQITNAPRCIKAIALLAGSGVSDFRGFVHRTASSPLLTPKKSLSSDFGASGALASFSGVKILPLRRGRSLSAKGEGRRG